MGLLEKITGLRTALIESKSNEVSFAELAESFMEYDRDVYIIDQKGKLLASTLEVDGDEIFGEVWHSGSLPAKYNKKLKKVDFANYNIKNEKKLDFLAKATDKSIAIVPIYAHKDKLGQLIFVGELEFSSDEMIFCEMAATIAALEITHTVSLLKEKEAKKIAVVDKAIGTLSYSELEAVQNIIEELDGEEGILVASRIADRAGITRSVIVNALRKLESADVISSHSLGMKGTRIKILNDKLRGQLKAQK